MSREEDLEFVNLLETMSPEELSELSDSEMDALLEAKMRISAEDNPDDETLQRFTHDTDGDEPDGQEYADTAPTFGEPNEFEQGPPDDADYDAGFDIEPGEDTGLSGERNYSDESGYNPAVAESVGQSSPVDFDSFDAVSYTHLTLPTKA